MRCSSSCSSSLRPSSSIIEIIDGEKIIKQPYKAPAELRVVEGHVISEISDVLMRDRKVLTLVEGDVLAQARREPGKLSYGSSGPGTLTHLAMEQLKVAADLDMVHLPYRGIGPAFTDIDVCTRPSSATLCITSSGEADSPSVRAWRASKLRSVGR